MIEVLIFGASEGGRKVVDMLNEDNVEILAYIDNDEKKIGQKIDGKEVMLPEKISGFNYDYILIASMYFNEIFNQLINMGINESKIIEIYGLNSNASKGLIEGVYNKHLILATDLKFLDKYNFLDIEE